MQIVILDGHALNPGDLSWNEFNAFGTVTIYDRTPEDKIVERIGNAEIVITNKVTITDEIMAQCPAMRYIGVLATGYNIIDVDAAKKRNIIVTNIPAYSTKAVAQATFALLFELTNGVHAHNESVQNGAWVKSPDFTYWTHPLTEVAGKTLGIIGFGDIGMRVALIAKSLGMSVIASTRTAKKIDDFNKKYASLSEDGTPVVKNVSKEEVFAQSDVLSLHCPLTKETENLVNEKTLALMKKSAILINTSRGPLVDENAVKNALQSGKIAGFACDVVSVEPMQKDNPLLGAPNCIITPHVAWAAKETRERLLGIAVKNLKDFLAGNPQNVVC